MRRTMARIVFAALIIVAWIAASRRSPAECDIPPEVSAEAPQIGGVLPVWEGIDDGGRPWRSTDYVGSKIVVIYFYPGDFTSGCVRQAQAYREALARLE